MSETKTGKAHTVNSGYGRVESEKWYDRVYSDNPAKQQHDYIAQPVNMTGGGGAERSSQGITPFILKGIEKIYKKKGYIPPLFNAYNAAELNDKSPTLTTGGMVTSSCAVNIFEKIRNKEEGDSLKHTNDRLNIQVDALPRPNGELSKSQGFRIYDIDHKSVTIKGLSGGSGGKTGLYATPIHKELTDREMDYMFRDHAERRWAFCVKPGEKDKSPTIVANIAKGIPYNVCADSEYKTYAEPCEWSDGKPVKARSYADGKLYSVYEVSDGQITIKEKRYPIKLTDGFYIIRKLTVSECKRLQTVPEDYEFPVSDSQSYKMLGNGWTCDVITHLINATRKVVL